MRPAPLLAAALALLAGCAVPAPEDYATGATRAAAESRSVGTNARGEACLAQRGTPPALDAPVARAEEVFCGGWTQPAARVFVLATRVPSARAVADGAWRSWLDARLQCGAPTATTIGGGTPAQLLTCQRRATGAPYLAIAIDAPSGTVLADGLPAALPAIERVATGREQGLAARSDALQIALARLPAQRAGAGDEAEYERLMSLGLELNQTEDFAAAEDAYRQALALRAATLGRDDDPSLATPLMHVALNLSNQNQRAEAVRLFARAEGLAAASPDRTAAARLSLYRGLHEMNGGRLDAARAWFDAAEAEFRATIPAAVLARSSRGDAMDFQTLDPQVRSAVLGLAEALRHRSTLASRRGDTVAAREDLRRSREALRLASLSPAILQGRALRTEAVALARGGNPRAAAERLSTVALRLSASLPGERPVAVTHFLEGRAWAETGQDARAIAAFREGAQVLERRRIGVGTEDILSFLDALDREARRDPASASPLREEAFRAAQLGQRSETARFLAQAGARLASAQGNERVASAVRRREDLELEVRALLLERDAATAAGRGAGDLDARIAQRRAEREAAEEEAQAAAPAFRQLRDQAIRAPDLLAVLRPDEALVQFVLGAEHSFAISLRPGRAAALVRLDLSRAEAGRLVGAIRAAVDGDGPQGGVLPRFDVEAAAELHRRLLEPLGETMRGARTLVIVPDGPLQALPFGMLLTGPGDAAALSSAPWLIRRHAVVHAPSVQAFVRLRQNAAASTAPEPYLGFGDFLPPGEALLRRSFPPARCGDDAQAALGLGRLPGSSREVQLAARVAGGGAVRLGTDFTAASVAGAALDRYRIVHFATHGLLPTELACLSEPSILASLPRGASDASAAFITASAIMRMRMDADLVILSACNTAGPGGADGSSQAGEALSGLARAFFVAGARGLLATHWLASDAAAVPLVVGLVSAQAAGASTAQALREVQLALLTDLPGRPSLAHPFYWAPFALLGDGRREGAARGS